MERTQPRGLNRSRVFRLLSKTSSERFVTDRIETLSGHFLGQPYQSSPLVGSAECAEVFVASLDGFDCVTYIETVLALARAASVDEFVGWLRRIRYENGRIEWARRNHYMTGWIRNNVRAGIIKPVSTPGIALLSRQRILNVVSGLAVERIRVKCVPKRAVMRLAPVLHTADLLFFVSTRAHLDVFHAGIIVRDGERTQLRHASRSRGRVVEQELRDFIKENRMAGVIVARPQQRVSPSQSIGRAQRVGR